MTEIFNRKARFDYEILDTYIAGLVLVGNEVKAVREGKVSINESFCTINNGEVFLHNSNITIKDNPNSFITVEANRDRKLLLNKIEIKKLTKSVEQKGNTIIPLKLFFNDKGIVKVEIALCRGKHNYDKREAIKERDIERDFKRYGK